MGIPCIFTEANSHKTLSLQKDLNYHNPKIYNINFNDNDIFEILNLIEGYKRTIVTVNLNIKKQVWRLINKINTSGLYKKIN